MLPSELFFIALVTIVVIGAVAKVIDLLTGAGKAKE